MAGIASAGIAAGSLKTGLFTEVQHIARQQRAAGVPAELAQRKGRAAAQVGRHLNAAPNREIGAAAGVTCGAHRERRPGRDGGRRIEFDAVPVERGRHRAPVRQMIVSALNVSVGPDIVISRPAALGGLPTARFPRRNDRRVHRPGGRHADVPEAHAPRIILHGGLRARRQHLDRSRRESKRIQGAGGDAALRERARSRRIGAGTPGWSRFPRARSVERRSQRRDRGARSAPCTMILASNGS